MSFKSRAGESLLTAVDEGSDGERVGEEVTAYTNALESDDPVASSSPAPSSSKHGRKPFDTVNHKSGKTFVVAWVMWPREVVVVRFVTRVCSAN